MKMQPDRLDGVNAITRLDTGRVWVHQTVFAHSVLIPFRGTVQAWPVALVDKLQAQHFETAAALGAELLILGTGPRLKFPSPAVFRPLIDRGLGYEVMDTAAACRTYNVLASEGRAVVAALILG